MNGLRYGAMALALTSAVAFAGCGLGDPGSPSAGNATPTTPGSSSGSSGSSGGTDCVQPACQDVPLTQSPHASRLTNAQWELTTRDLLGLPGVSGLAASFPQDPVGQADKFGTDATTLQVTDISWLSYQSASEQLADLVTGDTGLTAALLPPAAQNTASDIPTRMTAFVSAWLPKAYRRPVTPTEISSVVTHAATSAGYATSVPDAFLWNMRWAIATVLQSGEFLYRVYFGDDAKVANGRARLTPYELASKLSYGIWNTMPDDKLTAHATAGDLDTNDGVANVAREILSDARASAALIAFHDLLYLTNNYATDLKNARTITAFPQFYPEFADDAAQDIRLSVNQIVVQNHGGFKDLATSDIAFVNTRLAPIYDLDPTTIPALAGVTDPSVFVQISMDPTKRKGIMLHPGWLADEGTGRDPSIIHRGVYMARHVDCVTLGSPPPGAAGANVAAAPGDTNRERVTNTTHPCGDGCHGGTGGVINPVGFALEGFDSIGKVRANDYGFPLDLTGTTDQLGDFNGAVDLFSKIGDNARSHACYVAHWSAFMNSTWTVDVTPKWLSPAVAKSLSGGSVIDVIVELAQTDAFLTVSR